MGRPAVSGDYAVPGAIMQARPTEIPCTVKVIYTTLKSGVRKKHYYVYELNTKKGSKSSGDEETVIGKAIGKIEGGTCVLNALGRLRIQEAKGISSDELQKPRLSSSAASAVSSTIDQTALKATAANMNLDMSDIDIQIKNYGEYAIVLSSTVSVLEKLNRYFSPNDSLTIYVLSMVYFVAEYTPASYLKDVYDQSILSSKWPALSISENSISEFLKLLGTHPLTCEKYSQALIDESSGTTAIDGHVVLSCSKQNDLADYGNKYHTIKGKQVNILQAYDVINDVPLTSKSFEGGLLDKCSVKDLLQSYDFPSKTTFLVDMGFYSEEDFGLYRNNGKHFVIPIPDSAVISKAIKRSMSFSSSFTYKKIDEDGIAHDDRIMYRESTVKDLEDEYQSFLDEQAEAKNKEELARCKPGEKPKKHYSRKINRSQFGEDRVIMFRDEEMHEKMVAEFVAELGSDEFHTEEKLQELGPTFGVIVMRTNLDKLTVRPSAVYENYKLRWGIETHYNFVKNIIKFSGLQTCDYYRMQGLSFLLLVVGQVKAAFMKTKNGSSSSRIRHLSVEEMLTKAAHVKISLHREGKWCMTITTEKVMEIMREMGANASEDLKKLNEGTY